jgi:hypothetical protein
MSANSEPSVPDLGEEKRASPSSGLSAPLLSLTAVPSSGGETVLTATQVMQFMETLKATQESNQQMMKELRRMTRRQSGYVPPATPLLSPPTPPKVSSTTHSSYASLETPAGTKGRQVNRMSLGGDGRNVYEELQPEDDVDSDEEEKEAAEPEVNDSSPKQAKVRDTEATTLAKIMAKVKAPKTFSGATEEEREGVQAWTNDLSNYLQGQFGRLKQRHPDMEWLVALPLFEGTARQWLDNARLLDPEKTWEDIKPTFIEFIRGSRESRGLQVTKMLRLVYGQGKCKDLLSLEKEFEELRMRLYPSSSTSAELNEVVGRWYSEAISRGDPELYNTMMIMLGGIDQPTLSQWKAAAAKAVQVRQVTVASQRGRQQAIRAWNWQRATPTERVNELSEGVEEEEGKNDPGATAAVQQMQGRRPRPKSSTPFLPDDVWEKVKAKGVCFQCYQPGHMRGDATCKEKGKPRRQPTAEELKGLKA